MANEYDNQQYNPQSLGQGHTQPTPHQQPQPQYGAMATPEQPGRLNGQDYYPGSGSNQPRYSDDGPRSDDAYYQDHLRRQGQTSAPNFGHNGRSITDGIAGMGHPGQLGGHQPPQELPSRTWPIVLTVVGFVTSLVLAPIVFFTMTFYSFSNLIDLSDPDNVKVGKSIELGKPVEISQEGESILLIDPNADWQCDAINEDDGSKIHFGRDSRTSSDSHEVLWSGSANLSKGTYTFECTNPDKVEARTVSFVDAEIALGAGLGILGAFGVGTLLGIGGLIAGIVGVIWLVRRNKERRKIQLSNAFGSPMY